MKKLNTLQDIATAWDLYADMKDPELWLMKQLRSGRFRGQKVGRHWRMSDADAEHNLEVCTSGTPTPVTEVHPLGLTAASLRRRAS